MIISLNSESLLNELGISVTNMNYCYQDKAIPRNAVEAMSFIWLQQGSNFVD